MKEGCNLPKNVAQNPPERQNEEPFVSEWRKWPQAAETQKADLSKSNVYYWAEERVCVSNIITLIIVLLWQNIKENKMELWALFHALWIDQSGKTWEWVHLKS